MMASTRSSNDQQQHHNSDMSGTAIESTSLPPLQGHELTSFRHWQAAVHQMGFWPPPLQQEQQQLPQQHYNHHQ